MKKRIVIQNNIKGNKGIHTNKDTNAVRMMLGNGEGHFCLPGLREVVKDDEI